MKKVALSLISLLACTQAFAVESKPKVTIGGTLDTQFGYRKQSYPFNNSIDSTGNIVGPLRKSAIVNETKLEFKIEGKSSKGFKYGGLIKLNADTSTNPSVKGPGNNLADKTLVYMEGNFGKLAAGDYNGPASQMQVAANTIAKATGGVDGKVQDWISQQTPDGDDFNDRFLLWPSLSTISDLTTRGAEVMYFTPQYNGFQFGIGYTPDIEMFGTVAKTQTVLKNSGAQYEDIFDAGINYEHKFLKDYTIKIGLIGEAGKAKQATTTDGQRSSLRAWELGTIITYKDVSVAGSYGNWGKSGTPKVKVSGAKYGSRYWTAGVSYDIDKLGLSVTYMHSKRANAFNGDVSSTPLDKDFNSFKLLSFGAEYKLAPGFLPYAEINCFKSRQSRQTYNNKGYVFLAGTKLSF